MTDTTTGPRAVSIFKTLATLPSGAASPPLRPEEFQRYLKTYCDNEDEQKRNQRHVLRDQFYRDGGLPHIHNVIEKWFKDPTVRELRKNVAPYANFNNTTKRLVNEMSTVYTEPAKRYVADAVVDGTPVATPNNDKYQTLLETVCMDEQMEEIGRLLNLHRSLLVGFRVRMLPNGEREPLIEVATPANVRCIVHPNDDKLIIGWLIKTSYRPARNQSDVPAWTLWTDFESMQLTGEFAIVPGSYQEHKIGLCPWVPITLAPAAAGFWPGWEGEDMIAGHITIWLENILLIKESKSATKQNVFTGDGTNVARGQSGDSEVPVELADGQSATTVDMSMDLDLFKGAADHVLQNLAQNYGLSPALITHQGVQSAEARELMRLPLKEIRRRQQVPFRRFEKRFVLVMAAVLTIDLPSMAFKPDGFRVEFAESETPLDPAAEQDLFEKRRAAGLDNTVAFLMRKNPGLTADAAWAIIVDNITREVERNMAMRPLMAISGSMGAKVEVQQGATEAPAADTAGDATSEDTATEDAA